MNYISMFLLNFFIKFLETQYNLTNLPLFLTQIQMSESFFSLFYLILGFIWIVIAGRPRLDILPLMDASRN